MFITQCDNASIKTETLEMKLPEKGTGREVVSVSKSTSAKQEHGKEKTGKNHQ